MKWVESIVDTLRSVVERRALVTVFAWAILVVATVGAVSQTSHLTSGGFDARGSQSQVAGERIAAEFPSAASATLAVVLKADPGSAASALEQAAAEVKSRMSNMSGVSVASAPLAVPVREQDPDVQIIPLVVAGGQDAATDAAKVLAQRLGIEQHEPARLADGTVSAYLAGQGALFAALQTESTAAVTKGELISFPVIALVLLLVFGSFLSMALPLVVGMTAVVVTSGIVYLLAQFVSMSVFVSNAVSMVGIGVAVDYTLFVLVRFRSEIQGGANIEQARRTAMRTSGTAAVLSGGTVIFALASLFLIDSTAMRSIAIGTILVVCIAMAITVTLVPAIIALFGDRLAGERSTRFQIRSLRNNVRGNEFWLRWSGTVMRRPALFAVAASATLLALAIPATDLRMGNSVLWQLPSANQARVGTELAGTVLGPGAGSPVQVIVTAAERDGRLSADSSEVVIANRTIASSADVAAVLPMISGTSGRSVLLQAVLKSDPESSEARQAVTQLRSSLDEIAGVEVVVGGTTATIMDFDNLVSRSMVWILAFIVVAGSVLLTMILRSPLLAAKAVVMNLLSLAAAYGVLVMVFQWGWLSWLGIQSAPTVDTITPPLILAITFGLSMDYEIFLLSRIREVWVASGDNAKAVGEGVAASARSISSAALIMVLVFLAFVLTGFPAAQRLGLGCAVAVAVDATIVRLILVPAAMRLFGEWNWWMPGRRPVVQLEAVA